jgi:hypothetical protein
MRSAFKACTFSTGRGGCITPFFCTFTKIRLMHLKFRLSSLLLVLTGCILIESASGQSAVSGQSAEKSFPASWVGKWKGTLTWYQGQQQRQDVPMELHILPGDSTDHYNWHIIYGTNQQDKRAYMLKPFNKQRGHWLIDELNSIVLDHFLIGDRLCATFSVGGNTILNNFQVRGDSMMVEFYNYLEKPIVITGGGDTTIPKVKTYGIRSHQFGVLHRLRT